MVSGIKHRTALITGSITILSLAAITFTVLIIAAISYISQDTKPNQTVYQQTAPLIQGN